MISAHSLRSDQFFTAFMDSAIGMALVGLDGRWLDVNNALCNIVGYSKDELVCLCFQDITHPDDLESDLGLVKRLLDGEINSYNLEKRYIQKNGSITWALLTVSIARNDKGSPDFFISQIVDISKQKRAEYERETFFELSPDLLAVADANGFLLHVSPAWTDVLGWTKSELTTRPFLDFVHPDDRAKTIHEAESLYAGNPTKSFRNRYEHRDGSWRWIEWNTRIVSHDRFYCSARDVTRQQEIDEYRRTHLEALDAVSNSLLVKLQANSTDLASQLVLASQLFESSPDCVKIIDLQGCLVAMNKNGQCVMEIDDCDALVGERWVTFWPEQSHGTVHSALEAARGGQIGHFEAFCPTAKGTPKWWDVMVTPILDSQGHIDKFLSVSRDVTVSMQAKEEVKKYTTHLEQITLSVPAIIFQWYARTNGEMGFYYISEKFEELYGINTEILMQDWTQVRIHPEDRDALILSIQGAVKTKSKWEYEGRLLLEDGSIHWLRYRSTPSLKSDIEIVYTGVILDITEEKTSAELKRSQEEKIQLLIENANDAFVGMNQRGIITEWNRQAEATFGWTAGEAIGRPMAELIIPPALRAHHAQGMETFLATGAVPIINKRMEVSARHKKGHDIVVEMIIGKMTLAGEHYFHAFLHDISVRKEAQRQLEEKQQLLDAVLDAIDVGVVACSGTGALTLFNRAARELHGLDAELMESTEWAEHYSLYAGDGKTLLELDQVPLFRALSGDTVHNVEMVIAPKGKPPRFLHASGRRLVGNKGESLGAVVAMNDVTDLKDSEKRLVINDQRLRAVTENVPAMIGHVDQNETLLFLNSAAASLVFQGENKDLIGRSLADAYGDLRYTQMKPYVDRALAGEKVIFERDIFIKGEQRHYHTTYVPDVDALGVSSGFYAMAMDITERKSSELLQAESEERLRTVTDNLPVLIAYIDHNEIYRFCNATYEQWFGVSPTMMIGKSVEQVLGKDIYELGKEQLKRNLMGERVQFETTSMINNQLRTVEIVGIPDIKEGQVKGIYVMTTDITDAKNHEKQLQLLARSDALTGLPNRRSYEEKLQEAALRAARSGKLLTLMFLDLDHFKQINDTLGHAGGDEVLREFATRLRLCVRATDTVCRLAGDEFTIILEAITDSQEAKLIAEKVLLSIQQPFLVQGAIQAVSTSIGITCMSADNIDLAKLAKQADQALYQAKKAGRNQFHMIARP